MFLPLTLLLTFCTLFDPSSATTYDGSGSYYSYTTTNHLAPPVTYALYKSPLFSTGYQYSHLPPVPIIHTYPSVHTSVWPSPSYKLPLNYYSPCNQPGAHVTSFTSHVIPGPPKVRIGKPVKTKVNNNTEHVFKPIYYPGVWGEYKPPHLVYQGTIQHGAPKASGDAGSMTTAKPETEEASGDKKAELAKSEETKEEEVDEGEKEDEKADAASTEAPKKAEETAIMPSKAKRNSVGSIAKGYGLRKNKRNSWNSRRA